MVTLERLDQKLDDVIESLKESKVDMQGHFREDRGAWMKLDRLVQIERHREWHFRTLWTAVLASLSAVGLLYFK